MAGGVLAAAHVKVHRPPVLDGLLAGEALGVPGVHVAQEIPAAAGPAGHGGGLQREALVGPVLGTGQRRFARFGGLVFVDLRQAHGQVGHVHRARDVVLVVDGDGLAPVALAAEGGVAQAEVHPALPGAQLLQFVDGPADGLGHLQALQEALAADGGVLPLVGLLVDVRPFGDGDDGQAEVLREAPVALIAAGHGHDGAGAVAGQHVVAHPDGHVLPGEGMLRVAAGEHAGDAVHLGLAFALAAVLGLLHVGLHLGALGVGGVLAHQHMLGRQGQEGDAEERVGPGGEHLDEVVAHGEAHAGTFAAADPVALGLLQALAPGQPVQPVEQALGVGGDAQAPLGHAFAFHGVAAALAHAVLHLVVGQHGAQGRAPVHPGLAQVGQAEVLEHHLPGALVEGLPFGRGELPDELLDVAREHRCVLPLAAFGLEAGDQLTDGPGLVGAGVVPAVEELQEDPLRPFVVVGIAGAHLAVPVEAEADAVQLLPVAGGVHLGGLRRVLAGLDGVLLGGQAEGVVAHGVQHVEALVPLVARHDVAGDVAQRVPHVQAGPARVGEHVQHVELGAGEVLVHPVGVPFPPGLLPFALDRGVVVLHGRRTGRQS